MSGVWDPGLAGLNLSHGGGGRASLDWEESMRKFYQIGADGRQPQGGLFETMPEAEREVAMLRRDDQRFADEAMREAGLSVHMPTYKIHEVQK